MLDSLGKTRNLVLCTHTHRHPISRFFFIMFPLQRKKHNPLKKWKSAKPSTRDYRNWKAINVSEKNQTKPTRKTSWILSPSTRYDLVHLHCLPQCYWGRKKYEHHYISQAFIAARDEGWPQAGHFYSPVKIFFFLRLGKNFSDRY